MTRDEINRMAAMLSDGYGVSKIARSLGYSTSTISTEKKLYEIESRISQERREAWVGRIESGRYTKAQAAKFLHVPQRIVFRWIKEANER